MIDYVEVITGGSGEPWTGQSLMQASLKKIRDAVEGLLREYKTPLSLERGLVSSGRVMGIAGPFTIYWRNATKYELDAFDYDTWLVYEFSDIEVR